MKRCGEEVGVVGHGCGVCGEGIGCRLLCGFLEDVCSDYGEHGKGLR